MIQLSQLPKITKRRKKRLGRGYGSGVGGHTVGRGAKGFKARNKVPLIFDGTKIKKSWLKRLPFWRGKGRQSSARRLVGINLDLLEAHFRKGERVDRQSLIKKGLIKKQQRGVGIKILGRGKLSKALTVSFPCSQKAAEKIIKAGGKVKND